MGTLIKFAIGIAISGYGGNVLSHLWNWFVVPYFNISAMSWGVAWGLMVTFNLLRFKAPDMKKAKAITSVEYIELLALLIMVYSMMWGEGWLIHRYFLG